MDDPLIFEVFDRLDADAKISGTEEALVIGALLNQLSDVLDGTMASRPTPTVTVDTVPIQAYIRAISVAGFRGIGPRADLKLHPGPGLTLVVGRNGSGKSSFAEAAEIAMTGDSLRWSGKSKEWKSGWRNLHAGDTPIVEVALQVDGERDARTIRVQWNNDDVDSMETVVTVPGDERQTLESLGWSEALRTFRPFLSYSELSKIIEGRPVDRYNALAPMLGMETLQPPVEMLRQARLSAEKRLAAAKSTVGAALTMLRACDDGRASVAVSALTGSWDLVKVDSIITGTEPSASERDNILSLLVRLPAPDADVVAGAAAALRLANAQLESQRGSDGEQADRLAKLLQSAVDVHEQRGDCDCPVCGRHDGLAGDRVVALRHEIDQLRSAARSFASAKEAMSDARLAASDAIGDIPHPLDAKNGDDAGVPLGDLKAAWRAWIDEPADVLDLASHLESCSQTLVDATTAVRTAAANRQQALADLWRPYAEKLAELLPIAREGQLAERTVGPLKQAERWLKRCEAAIRDERFDAVKTKVKGVWETLATGSSVTLDDVRFGTKKVEMDVTVDGDQTAALGVMSQGELHALALSLFIPRVKFEKSPFGFAMLDDPVQAMDPVRVDGLARVLNDLSQTHQVVVFTHDDRLPAAVRQLQIPATVLRVTRRPKSEVELEVSLDPIHAALGDARALMLSNKLPPEVSLRVVPGLCRQAIEAACLQTGRRQLQASGLSHAECEDVTAKSVKLLPRLALALFGDAGRAGDVYGTLNNKFGGWAADTVRSCNEKTHAGATENDDLKSLIGNSQSLAEKLAAL